MPAALLWRVDCVQVGSPELDRLSGKGPRVAAGKGTVAHHVVRLCGTALRTDPPVETPPSRGVCSSCLTAAPRIQPAT